MNFQNILFETREGIAELTLNRSPLNILNISMLQEINSVLEKLNSQTELKLLVIKATGKAFSAGVDVGEHTKDKVNEMIKTFHQTFLLLDKLEIPTLAVVQGSALGGGCELAGFCDLVIASEEAKFGQPEIKVGVFPPGRVVSSRCRRQFHYAGLNFRARLATPSGFRCRMAPACPIEIDTSRWTPTVPLRCCAPVSSRGILQRARCLEMARSMSSTTIPKSAG